MEHYVTFAELFQFVIMMAAVINVVLSVSKGNRKDNDKNDKD